MFCRNLGKNDTIVETNMYLQVAAAHPQLLKKAASYPHHFGMTHRK